MACGFASILFSIKASYYEAAMALILGAAFDSVDGRVARLTKTESSFGEQFDSISDMISFGLAPAILMYQKYLYEFKRLGIAIAFIYVLFAALRLARFNANIDKVTNSYFQGLPTPAAALAMVGYVLFFEKYPEINIFFFIPIIYTLLYAILMITNIPFNSFKDSLWVRKHKRITFLIFLIGIILTFVYYRIMFFFGMATYTFFSLAIYLRRYKEFGSILQWKEEDED